MITIKNLTVSNDNFDLEDNAEIKISVDNVAGHCSAVISLEQSCINESMQKQNLVLRGKQLKTLVKMVNSLATNEDYLNLLEK